MTHNLSRRAAIGGAITFAGATVLPSRALGLWRELLLELPEIIDLCVSIWRGIRVGQEAVAGARGLTLLEEINKFYGVGKFIIESYYEFSKTKDSHSESKVAEIGCSGTNTSYSHSNTLCLEASSTAVVLAPGHLLGLKAAADQLRNRFPQEAIASYTTPVRLWHAAEPCQPIATAGNRFKSDAQYYTPPGSGS